MPKIKKTSKVNKQRRKLFRDLEQDGVTYSFLSEFCTDREQARLSYVEGYTRDGIIEALDFGTLFHSGLEALADNKPVGSAVQAIKREGDNMIRDRGLKPFEAAQIQMLSTKARIVLPWYHEYWRQKKGHEYRPDAQFVSREESFRIEHELPLCLDPQGNVRRVVIRGRFDAIFRLKGKLWLMENKTKSQIDEEGLTASLSQDLQTMLYCHAIAAKYGETPVGVLYNVIRRPQLKQKQQESQKEFFERIEASIREEPDHYFKRWQVSLTANDVDQWVERSLNPLLIQVCLWWDEIKQNPFDPWKIKGRVHHFQNPEGLYNRYGKSQYFDLLTRKSTHGLKRRSQ